MKTPLTRFVALLLCVAPLTVPAADFTFNLTGGVGVNWDQANLWNNADSPPVPYPNGVNPGADDSILWMNYTTDQGVTGVPNLYLNGDRTIKRLEARFVYENSSTDLDKTATRIYSGAYKGNNQGVHNTLTITEQFYMHGGSYYLRAGAGSELTINAASMQMGDPDAGNVVTIFDVGSNTVGENRINLNFGETNFRGYAPRLVINQAYASSVGTLNLGHVHYDLTQMTGFQAGAYIDLVANTTGTPTTVTVASLSGANSETRGDIRGTGTILIAPTTSTLAAPSHANFNRLIQGGIRVEKTGSSLQTFSYANTYTGGTLIDGGVLSVRNTTGSGLGTGAVKVTSGGVLAGKGRIQLGAGKAIVVESGGLVAAGEDNRLLTESAVESFEYQTLTLEGTKLEMKEGAAFSFRVGAGGLSDKIAFTNYTEGLFALEGGNIVVNILGDLSPDQKYTLFTFANGSGNNVSSGLVNGLVAGQGFEGYNATFHYDEAAFGGVGTISVSVTAIPEQSAALLLLPISMGLLSWKLRGSLRK